MSIYNKMLFKLCFGFLLVTTFSDHVLHASLDDSDKEERIAKSTYFLIVPGQNGMGGMDIILERILNPKLGHRKSVKTPRLLIDFGQSDCQKYLDEVMTPLQTR